MDSEKYLIDLIDFMNVMYKTGYDDGQKAILDDLINVVNSWKESSEVVSCKDIIRLLESRKENI